MGNKSSSPAAAASKSDVNNNPSSSTTQLRPILKNFTLLLGCTTIEEHEACIRHAISKSSSRSSLSGQEGLKALGFEFRFVPCPTHASNINNETCGECIDEAGIANDVENGTANDTNGSVAVATTQPQSPVVKSASVVSILSDNSDINEQYANHDCHQCATRLFCVEPLFQTLQSLSTPNNESETTVSVDCQSVETSADGKDATEQPLSNDTVTNQQTISSNTQHAQQFKATMITPTNRQNFIANGTMYEIIANLAQQAAHERMCSTFDLEYVTVCNEQHLGEHIRALVDRDHRLILEEGENSLVLQELLNASNSGIEKEEKKEEHLSTKANVQKEQRHSPKKKKTPNKTKSTLLIATGRGKVRAGIFSRQHLLTAGIEVGTSWHCIREARLRKWGVAIIDPNARGEEVGYESFRRSFSRLFLDGRVDGSDAAKRVSSSSAQSKQRDETTTATSQQLSRKTTSQHSIYILAHSASGGQLVRHLREDPTLLPSIRAIAFTDSTHNVQWCKHDPTLQAFLQTKNCVYLRSNDVRSSQSCIRVSSRGKDIMCDCITCSNNKKLAGVKADTDNFWEHRFGRIKTLWAGTADHALSNWAGHESIWDHFDEHNVVDNSGDGKDEVGANDCASRDSGGGDTDAL